MVIVKNKRSSSSKLSQDLVLCGQGRIGRSLSRKLIENNISHQFARLDPKTGLQMNSDLKTSLGLQVESISQIKTLVIAIANRERANHTPSWYWHEIFSGFIQQLEKQELTVENILMVSSTRVYDGNNSGLIDVNTPAKPESIKGQQILFAEDQLLQSSSNVRILRASGLYGDEYSAYMPVMLTATDKCRFGVDIQAVVSSLYRWVVYGQNNNFISGIELLTDGKVYYQGNQYDMTLDHCKIIELSNDYRILCGSTSTDGR